ncbi:MAG: toll/interleukin-1 receptor domain-containing protein [Planctomycetes bacterium]|nr:toll/interleukin-1 receptor domain-containing protein [Planctomycetota bacterium]
MSLNLFISYSHEDEIHREKLVTHLSTLRRNGDIKDWHDRKITAGEEWKGQIDKNLKKAEIILFLVSSDFIASDYCYDVEAKAALEMHEEGKAKVVPVILRHCDWKQTPFAKLQALPYEAEPVSSWSDNDKAWLNIVTSIKVGIQEIKNKKQKITITTQKKNCLTKEFQDWLKDTEVEYSHRRKTKLFLEDIYIAPDLKKLSDIDKIASTICSDEAVIAPGFKIIFGSDQSGKTSLGKQYFKYFLQKGDLPILLTADDVKKSDINKIARKAYLKQHQDSDEKSYEEALNKIIIIDDYSEMKLNIKYQNKLLDNMKELFGTIVLLASESFKFVTPEISSLDDFDRYEIMQFGNVKRAELIEKWVTLGVEETIGEKELYSNVDALKLHIDSVVKKGIVPAKPIYLITLIQVFESFSPKKVNLTSYGHCYQYLIYRALEKTKIKNTEVDSYLNFLAEFAIAVFHNDGEGFGEQDLTAFFEKYHDKYLKLDQGKVIKNMLASNIFCEKNGRISFKYRYIYYFYVAKHLADNLTLEKKSKETIRNLLSLLHKEDCSNIIIFITHHTKDKWILDEIQLCMKNLFHDNKEATLEVGELGFMQDFIEKIPELVLEQREIEQERKKSNQRKDKNEKIEKKLNQNIEKLNPDDLLAQINRAFRGIELIGQVVRNRHGSLDKDTLTSVVEQAYYVGLRCLRNFIELSDILKDEIVRMITRSLQENLNIESGEVEKGAGNIFFLLTYGVIYGILRRIAFSVGSKEAEEIYERMQINYDTPAIMLINQAIELQFQKKVNQKKLKELSEKFKGNIVCDRILKEIVIQHIYMHYVDYKDKQRVSQILGIPVSSQRLLETKSKFKI